MAFNLFIAYDLVNPGQNYESVIQRIKSLGDHAHIQLSTFYVKSQLDHVAAHAYIREVMDANDRLAVIWAHDAFISNYPQWDLISIQAAFQTAA